MKEIEYFFNAEKYLNNWKPLRENKNDHEIQVIDLFCGAGGMSLGFAALAKSQGFFKVIGGGDLNKTSLATFSHNFNVPGLEIDVKELASNPKSVKCFLEAINGYDPNKKTVLIGCAPCQGFSSHRKKNWDKFDERNDLIGAFAEVCKIIQPDCVIMENVPELLSERYWDYFENFKQKLTAENYFVKQTIHNSASQGVPQERFRAIVIAMKTDFSIPVEKFSPDKYKTVRSAIGDLPKVAAGELTKSDPMHKSASHRSSTIDVIKAVPLNGGSRPNGIGPKSHENFNGFSDIYGRLRWDKPSITITHYSRNPASGRFVHPEQHRGLTAREAARLQSFPDGYEFKGGFDDVFRQIGEAVPPLLSLAVACSTLANFQKLTSPDSKNIIEFPINNSYSGVIAGIKNRNYV